MIKSKKKQGKQLLYAVEKKDLVKVNQLIAQNAPVNMVNERGTSILGEAAQGSSFEIVKVLLAAGAKVNTKDKYGDTALINAVATSFLDKPNLLALIHELLNAGAEIDIQNNDGMTAVMFAVIRGKYEIAEILIFAGANLNLRNRRKCTVFTHAIHNLELESALENALKKRAFVIRTVKQQCATKYEAVEDHLPCELACLVVEYEYGKEYEAQDDELGALDIRKWVTYIEQQNEEEAKENASDSSAESNGAESN